MVIPKVNAQNAVIDWMVRSLAKNTEHQDSILSLLKRLREVHYKHTEKMQEHTRPLILLKLYEEIGELQTASTWSNEMEEACDLLFMTFAYMFEISSDAEVLDWIDRKLQVIEERVGIKA